MQKSIKWYSTTSIQTTAIPTTPIPTTHECRSENVCIENCKVIIPTTANFTNYDTNGVPSCKNEQSDRKCGVQIIRRGDEIMECAIAFVVVDHQQPYTSPGLLEAGFSTRTVTTDEESFSDVWTMLLGFAEDNTTFVIAIIAVIVLLIPAMVLCACENNSKKRVVLLRAVAIEVTPNESDTLLNNPLQTEVKETDNFLKPLQTEV